MASLNELLDWALRPLFVIMKLIVAGVGRLVAMVAPRNALSF